METMKAVVLTAHGGPDKLQYHTDWPKPVPGMDEILVQVGACGLNNTDINTRTAWYAPGVKGATTGELPKGAAEQGAAWGGKSIRFPRIQGADIAGTVVQTGDQTNEHLVGKRVLVETWIRDPNEPSNMDKAQYLGSECDGGFAEFVKIPARQAHPVNSKLADAELATFATSYITAEYMLNRANVREDDSVLVSGASGGVGSALVQLAKRRGATVFAMCAENKHDAVRKIGADAALPRAPQNLSAALKNAAGIDSVSVAADVVGGNNWQNVINAVKPGGRYVCSGAIAGAEVKFDLRAFYLRDLAFYGATFAAPGTFADVVRYIEREEIQPLLAKTFPLKELREAQKMFLAKNHTGNIAVLP